VSEEESEPNIPWPTWYTRGVLPYLTNSALGPVWIVILLHIVAVLGFLIIVVFRDGRAGGAVPMLFFIGFSLQSLRFELRHQKRLGAIALSVTFTWVVAILFAYGSSAIGLF